MKKKNGFTLIELLAILVILAIIAVITIPKINKVINESKQNAARNSAYGYKDAVEKWQTSQFEVEDIYLDGNYTVSNGKLDNYTIPITGSAPSSGYLTYEDDDLISGCLVINGYEAIYQNGKFTSSGKGDCGGVTPSETTLYYTYDPNAEYSPNGQITSKIAQPNASWTYYVKETTQTVDKYYTIEGTVNGVTRQQGSFETLPECNATLNTFPQSEIEQFNMTCVELNKKITNEVCGVFSGTEVCIEPNKWEGTTENPVTPLGGNYIQSKKTEFEAAGCSCDIYETASITCNNDLVIISAHYDGKIYISNINNNTNICGAGLGNVTRCFHVENDAN